MKRLIVTFLITVCSMMPMVCVDKFYITKNSTNTAQSIQLINTSGKHAFELRITNKNAQKIDTRKLYGYEPTGTYVNYNNNFRYDLYVWYLPKDECIDIMTEKQWFLATSFTQPGIYTITKDGLSKAGKTRTSTDCFVLEPTV